MTSHHHNILIIGAGLSGLSAAIHAHKQGISNIKVLEASEAVGGRVRTDVVNGFKLDRGFQVFLTSYPEAKMVLNYEALKLKPYLKGARIRKDGTFHTVLDPLSHPLRALSSAATPIGEISDKLHVPFFVNNVKKENWTEHFESNNPFMDQSTLLHLQQLGFSDTMIADFFKPFFSGVFLEDALETPAQQFRFLFDMFAKGEATLPAEGMQAIPTQMMSTLPEGTVAFNQSVKAIQAPTSNDAPWHIQTESGDTYTANTVVMSAPELAQCVEGVTINTPETPQWKATTCYYFSATTSPLKEAILVLNAESTTTTTSNTIRINNVTVPSLLQPSYAPDGQHLISVSTLGANPNEVPESITTQLKDWFGSQADSWTHLNTQIIHKALPDLSGETLAKNMANTQHLKLADQSGGLYQCGDTTTNPSINGAMASGRLVIEEILKNAKTLELV